MKQSFVSNENRQKFPNRERERERERERNDVRKKYKSTIKLAALSHIDIDIYIYIVWRARAHAPLQSSEDVGHAFRYHRRQSHGAERSRRAGGRGGRPGCCASSFHVSITSSLNKIGKCQWGEPITMYYTQHTRVSSCELKIINLPHRSGECVLCSAL